MSDTIGRIATPEIVCSGTFPIVSEYPYGRASHPDVAIHQFGSGNAKIEQRFLLGTGASRFTVRRSWLRDSDRIALRDFWESKYGPYGAFTFNAPNDGGTGTMPVICRFANEPLSWEMVADWVCSVGVTLVEIPSSAPDYPLNATVTRFPSQALQGALLSQVQQVIPLIKIQPLEAGYPPIYLSDRRCTIGGQLYLPRLIEFDGISQGMGNEADDASFTFGNADRVMRDLANDVDLFRAEIGLSLFHVGTGMNLNLWKGDIVNWSLDAGPEFKITASDGLYELNMPYPTRKISRTCWKPLDSQACPYSQAGALDLVHFPETDASKCDKGYDTQNGCLAHGMKRYYSGILAEPQGVRIKDNSTGHWGFGRSPLTSTSLVADSIYDQVLPEIYTDVEMPVNCKVAAGRDESDFYEALGIVGEGPLGAFTPTHYEDLDGDGNAETFVGSTLDGQAHHGYPNNNLGLRQYAGTDPAGAEDWFSLDQSGDQRGGDWRKAYNGFSTFKDNFAAGTAFVVIRRSDAKGLQLSKVGDHAMVANVQAGIGGWAWTAPGVRGFAAPLVNPVWVAVNMALRARGLRLGADATTEQLDLAEMLFDVQAAVDAAAICATQVPPVVCQTIKSWVPDQPDPDNPDQTLPGHWEEYTVSTETQFTFRGVLQEEKPLRDWLQEVLMNCLGYCTFSFGKLKIGVRENSSAAEAFTEGNILFRSLQLAPLKPSFNHLTANFADKDFAFVANSVAVYDIDHATLIGGGSGPSFLKSSVNLSGTATKSQAARIVSVRLREELGGISPEEWKQARQLSFRTTVLALNTEPGMVCSLTHPDMPGGSGEFRVTSWRLNKDFSIDIQGRTTTDSMYDLAIGPKPADVVPSGVPGEGVVDLVPGDVTLVSAVVDDDGTNAHLLIEYEPPDPIRVFSGITAQWEKPDGSGVIAQGVDFEYNGDAAAASEDPARHGTCELVVPQPTDAGYTGRLYLTSRSRAYRKALVLHGQAGESPNTALEIPQATAAGFTDPGPAPDVTIVSAEPYYEYIPGKGWFFGFQGEIAESTSLDNYQSAGIYLHWQGDDRYLNVEEVAKGSTKWKTQSKWALGTNFSQDVDVFCVSRNRFGTENDRATAPLVTCTVESQPDQLPDAPAESTAAVYLEYVEGQWFFGFEGTVAEPTDLSNYKAMRVRLLWDGDDRYLLAAQCDKGYTTFKTDRWPMKPGWSQNVDVLFCPVNLADEEAPYDSAFKVTLTPTTPGSGPAAPEVIQFSIGTAQPDGSFLDRPKWDTLNIRMIWQWAIRFASDTSNTSSVAIFFKRPTGDWIQAPRTADFVAPAPLQVYRDAFAVSGPQLPTAPELWTFRAVPANKLGAFNTNEDGSPAGLEVQVMTTEPDGGIGAGNVDPNALGPHLGIVNNLIDSTTTTPDNMLPNPGFELDFKAWSYDADKAVLQSSGVYTGTKCAKITADAGYLTQHYFDVRPLDVLTLDAWVKSDAATSDRGTLTLRLRGWTAALDGSTDFIVKTQAPVTAWTQVRAAISIPNASIYTRLEVTVLVGGRTAGYWLVDNCCLRREAKTGSGVSYDAAGNLIIPNGGVLREHLEAQIVGIDQLENAQIIKNAHIIRAGINRLLVLDADIDTLRAAAIFGNLISGQVAYLGQVNANQVNSGQFVGHTLSLTKNNVVCTWDVANDTLYGNYVGIVVKQTANNGRTLVTGGGLAVTCPINAGDALGADIAGGYSYCTPNGVNSGWYSSGALAVYWEGAQKIILSGYSGRVKCGYLCLAGRNGISGLSDRYLWVDSGGHVRVGPTEPTASNWDTTGEIVGLQS